MTATPLSSLDVAFLCLGSETAPMHLGAVLTFAPAEPADPDRLVALLTRRAARIPELRRKTRSTLFPPGAATWVDDPDFSAAHHVHHHQLSTLYEPDPLPEFASWWIAEPLDPDRPLWSLTVATGLPGNGFAVLLKLHHALTDGAGAYAIGVGLLDETRSAARRRAPRSPQGDRHKGAESGRNHPISRPSPSFDMLHETSGSGDGHAASQPSPALDVLRGASEPDMSRHILSPPPGARRDASEPGDDHPTAQQCPAHSALRTSPEPSDNRPLPHPNPPLDARRDTTEPETDHPAPATPLDIPEPRKNRLPRAHPQHGALSSTPEPGTGRSTPRPRPPLDALHNTPEPTESPATHPHPPHDTHHGIPESTASPATPRPPHDARDTTAEPTSNHLTPNPPHDARHDIPEPATSHRPEPRSRSSHDTHHHTPEPVTNHPTPHQPPRPDTHRDTPKPAQPLPRPPRPRSPLDTLRQTLETATIASSVVRAARPPQSPVIAPATAGRRLGFAQLPLTDLRRIRRAHGGTTHDVVLAILSGALRTWLLNRGVRADDRTLRALVPVSVRGRAAEQTGGNKLSGYLCELPVGLDDPVRRLHRIRTAMARNKAAGPHRGAGAFPLLAERMPTLLHRLGTRTAGMAAPLLFDLVITSVPVPAPRLTLDGAPLAHVHPFVPLAPRQAVGIAVAPYRDTVHIGLQANADAVPDLGALRDAVAKSAAELVHTG